MLLAITQRNKEETISNELPITVWTLEGKKNVASYQDVELCPTEPHSTK